MTLNEDVLVPVLLILIIVDVVLIVAAIIAGRRNRTRDVAPASPSWEPWPVGSTADAAAAAADVANVEPAHSEMPSGALVGRDELTGLADAATWARLVADEDPRIKRYHRPVAVVLLELDGLDRLTMRLGDEAADRLMPAMADTLRRLAREADHVARLGPGTFGVLMPETDEVTAINYVERVRRACELWLESGAIALRLAIGWAATTGDVDLAEVQRVAAERMYVELRRNSRLTAAHAEPADRPATSTTPA